MVEGPIAEIPFVCLSDSFSVRISRRLVAFDTAARRTVIIDGIQVREMCSSTCQADVIINCIQTLRER